MKVKEPVRIRKKSVKNDCYSLYLDIYFNGVRKYEYLKLYLVPERTRQDRERNKNTLELASRIKSQRILEIQNNVYGFTTANQQTTLFTLMNELAKKRDDDPYSMWICAIKHIQRYAKKDIPLAQIDRKWVESLIEFLAKTGLAQSTQASYFRIFVMTINYALREELIQRNPLNNVKRPKAPESERQYLTVAEMRLLNNTPIDKEEVKRAFLFSCLTGLRYSDIKALTWEYIHEEFNYTRIIFRQKKTKGQEYLDITPQAVTLMGERKKPSDSVFNLPTRVTVDKALKLWIQSAGISKHITFHCARHTFAVMMLDLGTDIYTVSKLLGHRNIATTQIYARVLDKNKQSAVAKIPTIL